MDWTTPGAEKGRSQAASKHTFAAETCRTGVGQFQTRRLTPFTMTSDLSSAAEGLQIRQIQCIDLEWRSSGQAG